MRLGVKYKGDLKVITDDTPTEKPKLKDLCLVIFSKNNHALDCMVWYCL